MGAKHPTHTEESTATAVGVRRGDLSTSAKPSRDDPKRSRFFVWAAVYCALLSLVGFTPSYWRPLATSTPTELSPAVHVHGFLFTAWVLLFLVQSLLVARGSVATHRSLGLAGISIATAMVIFGFIVSNQANVERFEAGQAARAYSLGFSNSFALLGFAILFGLAIHHRRRAATHKRLMLFATCMLLTPPVSRLYRALLAPAPAPPWLVFVTIDVLLVACIAYDVRRRGRIHPVTLACGPLLLAFQILRFPIPQMQWWRATYDAFLHAVT